MQGYLSSTLGSFIVPVFVVLNPGFATVELLKRKLVLGSKLLEFRQDVFLYQWSDVLWSLWGHKTKHRAHMSADNMGHTERGAPSCLPNAELARHFRGDDGLRSDAIERALDTM